MGRVAVALMLVGVACAACVTSPEPGRWDALDATIAREADDPLGAALAWRARRDDPRAGACERVFARLRLAGLGERARRGAGRSDAGR